MFRKYVLPLIALGGFIVAFLAAAEARRPVHSQPAVVDPADNPYKASVSGAGIIEATSENVSVAPAIGGIVEKVMVKWGDKVAVGDPLYSIDERPVQAQIAVQKGEIAAKTAAVARANADLSRLQASPREEDKPIYKAKVDAAKALLADAQDQFNRVLKMKGTATVSEDEYNKRYWTNEQMKTQVQMAQADYDKLMAGAWTSDIDAQKAVVKAAEADLESANAKLAPLTLDLERLTVKSPMAGTVLRMNVRRGEYVAAAGAGQASEAALVIGDIDHLNVRVDIDENDVPRFSAKTAAAGFVRGATKKPLALTFVRIEPFIIPKKNLTGGNTERVDTRVLQVIYKIEKADMALYVGQQMDIFIETDGASAAGEKPATWTGTAP